MHNKNDPPLSVTIPMLQSIHGGEKELSHNEIARRSGIPQPTITRIISGESRDPRPDNVRKIAKVFGLTYEQICDVEYVNGLVLGGVRELPTSYSSPPISIADISQMIEEAIPMLPKADLLRLMKKGMDHLAK